MLNRKNIFVAPEFNEIFHSCNWTDKNENCKQLFTPVLTEEGVCYTFNMLNRKDIFKDVAFHIEDYPILHNNKDGWSLEKGYSNKAGKNTFPRRALSAGTKAGLTLTMTAKKLDLDYACKGPVQGFKGKSSRREKESARLASDFARNLQSPDWYPTSDRSSESDLCRDTAKLRTESTTTTLKKQNI